jgi:hypothetical protein
MNPTPEQTDGREVGGQPPEVASPSAALQTLDEPPRRPVYPDELFIEKLDAGLLRGAMMRRIPRSAKISLDRMS